MNFLAICQRLRQECGVPGTGPTTVVGQAGELKRIVDWAAAAYDELQGRHPHWRWLRSAFTVNTVLGDDTYAYGDCTDSIYGGAIARFRRWWPHDADGLSNAKIYLQSAGVGGERWFPYLPWNHFRSLYRIGTQNNGQPAHFTIDPLNNLVIGPKPDGVYVMTGEYQRGNQTLAADADIPEMPVDYHMLIVAMGMERSGRFNAASEVFNGGGLEGGRLLRQLELEQLPQMTLGGPLA